MQGLGAIRPHHRGRARHRRRLRDLHERLQRRVRALDRPRTHVERPVATYGNVSWNDKPVLTTSADGRHVYVSWNGPQGGDPWMAVSHDRGATWTQTEAVDSDRYYFAFDA